MVMVQSEQALTLAAIITEGTFDAAAQRLHLTPSAVSQRVRALEMAIGRPVLRRVDGGTTRRGSCGEVRPELELLSVDSSNQLEPSATACPLGSRSWSTAIPCTPTPYPARRGGRAYSSRSA
jgi:LysR family transcriptional regulator (chromosome initiation inhibitor)